MTVRAIKATPSNSHDSPQIKNFSQECLILIKQNEVRFVYSVIIVLTNYQQ